MAAERRSEGDRPEHLRRALSPIEQAIVVAIERAVARQDAEHASRRATLRVMDGGQRG